MKRTRQCVSLLAVPSDFTESDELAIYKSVLHAWYANSYIVADIEAVQPYWSGSPVLASSHSFKEQTSQHAVAHTQTIVSVVVMQTMQVEGRAVMRRMCAGPAGVTYPAYVRPVPTRPLPGVHPGVGDASRTAGAAIPTMPMEGHPSTLGRASVDQPIMHRAGLALIQKTTGVVHPLPGPLSLITQLRPPHLHRLPETVGHLLIPGSSAADPLTTHRVEMAPATVQHVGAPPPAHLPDLRRTRAALRHRPPPTAPHISTRGCAGAGQSTTPPVGTAPTAPLRSTVPPPPAGPPAAHLSTPAPGRGGQLTTHPAAVAHHPVAGRQQVL